jgi:hypothetical protein
MRAYELLNESEYHVTFRDREIRKHFTVNASSEKDAIKMANEQLIRELPANQRDTASNYKLSHIEVDTDYITAENIVPGSNPTVTPKSSEFSQSNAEVPDQSETPDAPTNQAQTPGSPMPADKSAAISNISANRSKNMIDQTTATKQLKAQGVSDADVPKYLHRR